MNTVLEIIHLASGAMTLLPIGLEAAKNIKALLDLDPDYKVSIKQLTDAAIAADEETIIVIEQADPTIKDVPSIPDVSPGTTQS